MDIYEDVGFVQGVLEVKESVRYDFIHFTILELLTQILIVFTDSMLAAAV